MRRRSLRALFVLTIAVGMALGISATTAVAAPTPATLSLDPLSPGSSWLGWGGRLGIFWSNQNTSLAETPTLYSDSASGTITLDSLAYSHNGSAYTSMTADPTGYVFSTEGLYSFEATGTDEGDESYVATDAIGIDRTRPTSRSNLVPVYTGSALITITVTDHLSGPAYIYYWLDGDSQYCYPDNRRFVRARSVSEGRSLASRSIYWGETLDVSLSTATPGRHRLNWFTVDFAGNHEAWHQTTFQVNRTGYVPVLGRPWARVDGHRVSFRGSVTAASHKRYVTLTVQRRSGGSWVSHATYTGSVTKYQSAYFIKKSIGTHGTYRVKATQGTGKSRWSKPFHVH
jgi:hypothetical protein